MLLFAHTLPQLAVSAKFLCLLMVACCGADPRPYAVRSVRLYSDCSRGYLSVLAGGRVVAKRNNANLDTSNLTMTAWAPNYNLTIFAEDARRYICFDKQLKLVAEREKGAGCFFLEEMDMSGYNKYRLAHNQSVYLGFNKAGRPLRGRPAPRGSAAAARRQRCMLFININRNFSVEKHNSRKAGAAAPAPPAHRTRHHRPAPHPFRGSQRPRMAPTANHLRRRQRGRHHADGGVNASAATSSFG